MNNVGIYIKDTNDEYVRLDLFEDETIQLYSSIQNIKDITKTYTDFTQTFNVPASQNNNKVFKHWYDKNISNGFDGRTRSDAYIEINYTPFKKGNIQLDGVDLRGGVPYQYKITFFGLLVNLKDRFRDETLSDLDFSDMEIPYTFNGVRDGLGTEYSGSIIYPMISIQDQWYYDSGSSSPTASLHTKNIDYESGTTKGIEWKDFKPAVRVTKILDKIEDRYGITFSDDFTSTPVLDNLYLWCSREKGRLTMDGVSVGVIINWTGIFSYTGFINLGLNTWDNSVWYTPAISGGGWDQQYFNFQITIAPASGFEDVEWQCDMQDHLDGYAIKWSSGPKTGTRALSGTVSTTSGYVRFVNAWYVKANSAFTYTASISITRYTYVGSVLQSSELKSFIASAQSLVGDIDISNQFPDIKVTDFLNGLIKMYNLVVIPITNDNIYLDTLDNWYISGSTTDITNQIKMDEMTVERVDVPSNLEFAFEEPTTILANEYLQSNGQAYGDLSYQVFETGSQKVIYGSPLVIKLPFEQMVYERLYNLTGDAVTNIQYGAVIDDGYESVLMKPHLFYAKQQQCSGSVFGLIDTGTTSVAILSAWMPFHGNTQTNPEYTTTFNSELNEWDYSIMSNTLFSRYWSDYIVDLYDISRRTYKLTANLNAGSMLKLSDSRAYNRLTIGDTRYIINDYSMNLVTGDTRFTLLNDVYVHDIDNEAPTAPTNLRASNITTSSMDLTWDASTDNDAIAGYFISKNDNEYVEVGNVTTVFIDNQISGSTNTWNVNAFDVAGNISPTSSDLVLVQLPVDETAPASPTFFTASYVTETDITLEWNASAGDIPNESGLAGYRLYRNGSLQYDTTNLIYTSSAQTAGSTNFWVLTAYDNAGNESLGINISVTQSDLANPVYPIYLSDSGLSYSCEGTYTTNTTYYIDRNTTYPQSGDKVYTNSDATTLLNGQGHYWWYNPAYQCIIYPDGTVGQSMFCQP